MEYLIYVITNQVNGKEYVGLTSKSLKRRFQLHLWDMNSGSEAALHRAIRKYGEESFSMTAVDLAKEKEEAYRIEREWISDLGTFKGEGYNECPGGAGTGHGKDSYWYGRTRSDSFKRAISEAKRGENHHNAQVSTEDVVEIRERYKDGEQLDVLGEEFEVKGNHVTNIVNGESWTCAAGPIKGKDYKYGGEQKMSLRRGRIILGLRKHTNLNKTEVARLFGLTHQAVSCVENRELEIYEDISPATKQQVNEYLKNLGKSPICQQKQFAFG